jgi:hypothetical protein
VWMAPDLQEVFHADGRSATCGHVYGLWMRRDMAAGP